MHGHVNVKYIIGISCGKRTMQINTLYGFFLKSVCKFTACGLRGWILDVYYHLVYDSTRFGTFEIDRLLKRDILYFISLNSVWSIYLNSGNIAWVKKHSPGAVLPIGSGRRRTACTHEELLALASIWSRVLSAARAECLTLSHYPLFSGCSPTLCSL